MKSTAVLAFAIFAIYLNSTAQNIPEGYLIQYEQDFTGGKALADFRVNDPDKWGIFKNNANFYLQCASADSAQALPANLAMLGNHIFGDFIMEADIMPGSDTADMLDVCLYLGYRNTSTYYYAQFSNQSDSTHHGIFLVKNSKIIRLTDDSAPPVNWIQNKWNKVRIERNIISRTIRIYLNDTKVPLMQIKNYELVMGSVGFGSFQSSARFDNIKIWAPTVLTDEELKQMER